MEKLGVSKGSLVDILHHNSSLNCIDFAILVFGSRSYNGYTDESDIDLFFVANRDKLLELKGEEVLVDLGFEKNGIFYSKSDIQQLLSREVDLCQIYTVIKGVRADIHLTTIEVLNEGFLASIPRRSFWNKFKQPFNEDYQYTLATFSGTSLLYKAEYRQITDVSYIKESPSIIDPKGYNTILGHLLEKLLTSNIVYDCNTINVKALIEYDLWCYLIKQIQSYIHFNPEAFDGINLSEDYFFEDIKCMLLRNKRFSPEFVNVLKKRFFSALNNLNEI
jgi:predicted nucleotidyltransferase